MVKATYWMRGTAVPARHLGRIGVVPDRVLVLMESGKVVIDHRRGQRGGALPDRVLMQVGLGRGTLVTAVGQLVRRCPRALQIHQLWCGPCRQSCAHIYRLYFTTLHWCSDDQHHLLYAFDIFAKQLAT